jgi:hypothetical protein
MRHGRRHFTKHPRSVVLAAGSLDLPRRRGLLLWLSGLVALLYVVQLHASDRRAAAFDLCQQWTERPACDRACGCAPRPGAEGPVGPSTFAPNG